MLIDTHCHLNMVVKEHFDAPLQPEHFFEAKTVIEQAKLAGVLQIINVGTSLIESLNCLALAKQFPNVYATIGIHPNDLTADWKKDLAELATYLKNKEQHKIVGIGETGLDKHYKDYNLARQKDAFRAQIELSLEHNVGLVVHTRDAAQETLQILEEYKNDITRGIIHCFSEDLAFAQTVISWQYCIGLGATITYPKNEILRTVAKEIPLEKIVLETDAPFLPPQSKRGQKNFPAYIADTARFLASLKQISYEEVGAVTSAQARRIFAL